MPFFSTLYSKVLGWAGHRNAPWYLAGLGFAESSFFPVPPDVMLVPMSLARPERAWHYALLTTVASVLGGVVGYLIGHYAFEAAAPLIREGGYWAYYLQAKAWFDQWGVWVVILAGFSPIPYKVFTITAGTVAMAFIPFVIASVIGRGARFFIVAGLIWWGGAKMERFLRVHIERIGWLLALVLVAAYIITQLKGA